MLSSHRFLCLPLRLNPCTVPCRIVLVSAHDHATCPNHFSLRVFTEVRRSSYGPMAFPILVFTSSLGYVISVRGTVEFAETSHLQCLYPSFKNCRYGPRFTCIENYGHGQGTHQSDLEADGNVPVVPNDSLFGHYSCSLGCLWDYFGLGSLIRCYSSHIFKTTEGLQFLVVLRLCQWWCHWCYLSSAGSSLHWFACHMPWRPLHGDLPTWPALALVQLGRQCRRQNESLYLSCLRWWLFLHGLQVRQPLFSLRRWREWGRADILGVLQLWFGTILLCCCHGRLRWSPYRRGILWFWSGWHWCYAASWLLTKLHAKLCRTPSWSPRRRGKGFAGVGSISHRVF